MIPRLSTSGVLAAIAGAAMAVAVSSSPSSRSLYHRRPSPTKLPKLTFSKFTITAAITTTNITIITTIIIIIPTTTITTTALTTITIITIILTTTTAITIDHIIRPYYHHPPGGISGGFLGSIRRVRRPSGNGRSLGEAWAAAAAVFDGFGWTGRRMKSRQLLARIQYL
jgi:hypothetical protein